MHMLAWRCQNNGIRYKLISVIRNILPHAMRESVTKAIERMRGREEKTKIHSQFTHTYNNNNRKFRLKLLKLIESVPILDLNDKLTLYILRRLSACTVCMCVCAYANRHMNGVLRTRFFSLSLASVSSFYFLVNGL